MNMNMNYINILNYLPNITQTNPVIIIINNAPTLANMNTFCILDVSLTS